MKNSYYMYLLLITVRIDLITFKSCVFMPGCSPNPLWSVVPHPTGTEITLNDQLEFAKGAPDLHMT